MAIGRSDQNEVDDLLTLQLFQDQIARSAVFSAFFRRLIRRVIENNFSEWCQIWHRRRK